jgi:hypothetical protein
MRSNTRTSKVVDLLVVSQWDKLEIMLQVMIAERFDESMVLLADVLCWPLEKVVSLKVNARKPQLKVITSCPKYLLR